LIEVWWRPKTIIEVKLEERIIALVQGLSDHALAKDRLLAQKLEHFAGTVVRVTVYHPYVSIYARFTSVELEFLAQYEGDVDERLDIEASDILTALYVPDILSDLNLDQCLYIQDRPDLTEFLVDLCQKWDLWNLLATICSELMPFTSHNSALGREEFQLFRSQLEQKLQGLSEQNEFLSHEQRRNCTMLDEMQSQLWMIRFLLILLCFLVLFGCGLVCWLVL
jgi:hypothetical protein